MVNLEVINLVKKYNQKEVLKNLNFTVNKGEFLAILGPSGCGKTTLLKILIGIENLDSGQIIKNQEDITKVDPSKRAMGIVFQNYSLFPNMNVLENVSYALKLKLKNKEEAEKISLKFLKMVQMGNNLTKYPNQLSGGEQQRVAIARTLALKPDIILFDEPTSALDANNRLILRKEIKKIQKELETTIIYITHDQEEAFSMADRVMIMNLGKIEQLATPEEIFKNPKSEYVKEFVINHLKEKVQAIQKCIKVDL